MCPRRAACAFVGQDKSKCFRITSLPAVQIGLGSSVHKFIFRLYGDDFGAE